MAKLVVDYPPDFDGQTDIEVMETDQYFEYRFKQSKTPGDAWVCLVQVARGIIAQEERTSRRWY